MNRQGSYEREGCVSQYRLKRGRKELNWNESPRKQNREEVKHETENPGFLKPKGDKSEGELKKKPQRAHREGEKQPGYETCQGRQWYETDRNHSYDRYRGHHDLYALESEEFAGVEFPEIKRVEKKGGDPSHSYVLREIPASV